MSVPSATAPKKELHRATSAALRLLQGRNDFGLQFVEAKKSIEPAQLFLPGFDIGAMPNHLNRSSLIAPIARGARTFHKQAVMITRIDCVMEYTGEQLDEADGDLIMALIYFAQPQAFGTSVPLNRKRLLRHIKLGAIGSTQYEWLHKSMKRLRAATMFLEAKRKNGSTRYAIGKMQSFNIIKELDYDDETETYCYTLDPRWIRMFGNREYSLINWDKRMRIGRGQEMAKTLQRLVSTSSDSLQHYSLEYLKNKMQYRSPIRKFKKALKAAIDELKRHEIIFEGEIGISTKGKEQLRLWLKAVA